MSQAVLVTGEREKLQSSAHGQGRESMAHFAVVSATGKGTRGGEGLFRRIAIRARSRNLKKPRRNVAYCHSAVCCRIHPRATCPGMVPFGVLDPSISIMDQENTL